MEYKKSDLNVNTGKDRQLSDSRVHELPNDPKVESAMARINELAEEAARIHGAIELVKGVLANAIMEAENLVPGETMWEVEWRNASGEWYTHFRWVFGGLRFDYPFDGRYLIEVYKLNASGTMGRQVKLLDHFSEGRDLRCVRKDQTYSQWCVLNRVPR